jgi:hypothetical protein
MAYTTPVRPATYKKYKAIQTRFKTLYEEQRIRYDDVLEQLMREYFIDHQVTMMRILNTELPDEAPKKVVNPNQIDIFGLLEGGGQLLVEKLT